MSKKLTLASFDEEHAKFTKTAFPDITDYKAPLKHLKTEVDETMEGGEPAEYADCLMLLLSSFRLRYPNRTTDDLLEAAAAKLEINKARTWKTNSEGFAEHVKPEDAKPKADQLFDRLKVGDEILSRETKASEWMLIEVTSIDGDNVTFQSDYGEVKTDREEVNKGVYFKPLR